MYKNSYFYILIFILFTSQSCQKESEDNLVVQPHEIESVTKNISQAPLKESKTLTYKVNSFEAIDYYTINEDLMVLDTLDVEFFTQTQKNFPVDTVTLEDNFLTLIYKDKERKTFLLERQSNDFFLVEAGQNILLCEIKQPDKQIVVYQVYYQLFGKHKVAHTTSVYNDYTLGFTPKQNILEEYDFLEFKTGNIIYFKSIFDVQ